MMQILETLKSLYSTRGDEIENWFVAARCVAAPFFYTSVDLRHSGVRLAPVDTNLFPAGFNNLSQAACVRAGNHIRQFLQENYPAARKILLIPENHTRNLNYFDNLVILLSLFEKAGVEIKIGSLIAESNTALEFVSASGVKITQYPLVKSGRQLRLEDGFIPDLVVINNDLTSGIPEILQDVEQPLIPPLGMGWFRRRKSTHFEEYKKLVGNFCREFGIDTWLICAESHKCGTVDFKNKTSLECLAKSVDKTLYFSKKKYAEYGIKQEPYVYIKADSGTYGMGIMTVKSADEVMELNKKERNKMQIIKEGTVVSEVIIQEGIPTIDVIDNFPAEPMIYMIDGVPVGGMYRLNDKRDAFANLNAAGMRFAGMCDESEEENGKWHKVENCNFHAHGVVASIAALAAAREQY